MRAFEARAGSSEASSIRAPVEILTEDEIADPPLFTGKDECASCHKGLPLTDKLFHISGVPVVPGLPQDLGRETGVRLVREDPFNCFSPYSDDENCSELRFVGKPTHR